MFILLISLMRTGWPLLLEANRCFMKLMVRASIICLTIMYTIIGEARTERDSDRLDIDNLSQITEQRSR